MDKKLLRPENLSVQSFTTGDTRTLAPRQDTEPTRYDTCGAYLTGDPDCPPQQMGATDRGCCI